MNFKFELYNLIPEAKLLTFLDVLTLLANYILGYFYNMLILYGGIEMTSVIGKK